MGWPLVGQMWAFFVAFKFGRPDSFLASFISRYGRTGIYKTFIFGGPSIIVCTPETCKRVLTDDQLCIPGYPKATLKLMGNRSFHGISPAEHKRLRRLTASPINGLEALTLFVGKIENILAPSMEKWAESGQPVELMTEMNKVTYTVITNILFGVNVDYDVQMMERLFYDLAQGLISIPINLPGRTFHKALKARRKLVKILQANLDKRRRLKNKKEQATEEKDVLDLLMEVEDEDGERLDEEVIIDVSLMFLLADHETSAHATMWAAIFLKEHPEILQKLKKEQEEIIRRRPPTQKGLTLKEIRQMDYLSKVVDETLRRGNISFAVFREATTADVNINGYLVPKGWRIVVYLREIHVDPETYAKLEEFDPSRWEQTVKAKGGTFLPFGGGNKLCPGMDLAKLEMSIFLHRFVLHYDMERLNPNSPMVYLPGPRPSDHCLVKFTKKH
ncbi:ent-kaurenoic acid oxidase 2-like [Syzygium oleosum]|uniref:ent-kaurenoic acid oxidase 2-like n=1 Tax=Syzygium oleosum TaxID=219896 RepID=UPI0024BA399D|nr:ent-kaurenoic acid oxidase 2-like [Syzygium oleosum]